MSKFELTISEDYCPDWTIVEGVRELFQNALDQQTTTEDNDMFFDYDGQGVLKIGNKKSILEVKTLLLGVSTKRDDDKTIGKFGEGYKIATLVLLRLGKKVTFYNYGSREVWTAKFVNSRRFGTKILTFFVDKKYWQSVPDNNLTIVIEGVTPEEYEKIVASNLHLQYIKAEDCIFTSRGRILKSERHCGAIFVNGLFICQHTPYQCGYDFKPAYVKIDRDRKLMSDFDLQWLSSAMWAQSASPKIAELAAQNAADVRYIQHVMGNMPLVYDDAYETFIKQYGANAIPVINQDELSKVTGPYRPVIVSEPFRSLVRASHYYTEPTPQVIVHHNPFVARLEAWLDSVRNNIPGNSIAAIERIMDDMEEGYAQQNKDKDS